MPSPGLGPDHQKTAKALCDAAFGQPCPRCGVIMGRGRNPKAATADHIIARCLGGTNDPSNYRVICQRCNSQLGVMVRKIKARKRGGRRRPRVFVPFTVSRKW